MTKYLLFDENLTKLKIGPMDLEIIGFQEIIEK